MPTRSISDTEERELRAFVRHCRNMIFGEMYAVFAQARDRGEINQAEIAKKLGKDAATVSRSLGAPSNLEIDSIAQYLWAVGGAMQFKAFRAGRNLTEAELMADYDEPQSSGRQMVPDLKAIPRPRTATPYPGSTLGKFNAEETVTETASGA